MASTTGNKKRPAAKKPAANKTKPKTTGKKSSGSRNTKSTASKQKNKSAEQSFVRKEVLIWSLLAFCVLLIISNFGIGGSVGRGMKNAMQAILGWTAFVFPIELFGGVVFLVSNKGNRSAYIKVGALAALNLLLCMIFHLIGNKGGKVGSALAGFLTPKIGTVGTWVIILILLIICVVLITEKSVLKGVKHGGEKAKDHAKADMERRRANKELRRNEKTERERRRLAEQREAYETRAEHAVSGVTLNTTLEQKPQFVTEPKEEVRKTKRARSKRSGVVPQTLPDPNKMMKEAMEAEAAKTAEAKEAAAAASQVEDLVINRAMPSSVTELVPEEEKSSDKAEASEASSASEDTAQPDKKAVRNRKPKLTDEEMAEMDLPDVTAPAEKEPEYIFPPIDLLKRGSNKGGDSDAHLRETAQKLQTILKTFGVNATVTNISCGPSVTRYELQPEMGVKVSKIVGLADDIKLNLEAVDIRIEAPIPGKAAVGIEVPNKENSTVMLRDLLETDEFRSAKSKLAFATGRDIAGKVVVSDIAKMPHVLVAGATGSGKSVCINTLIISLIYKAKPEEVKLIMIDPKVVELSVYNGIPHLMIPVVTDPKKAAGALNWAVAEMDRRYQLFAKYNVRDLAGYNEKVESIEEIEDEEKPKKLPQIVIIVDELADLMMVAPGDVEEAICRLAQLARAAGLHLVLATQRPSVNVITGLIKANMPSRIAFSVSSGVDSRTIIDMNGAEKLLGKGDMLFYPAGYQKPVRVQGAFVSDKEVQAVVEFIKENHGEMTYSAEIQSQVNSASSSSAASDAVGMGSDKDSYFVEAGKLIIDKDKASIGMLQRMFKIGFNRAARIMDQLAEAGVVGEEEGTKPRKVLMSMEQFEQYIEEYL